MGAISNDPGLRVKSVQRGLISWNTTSNVATATVAAVGPNYSLSLVGQNSSHAGYNESSCRLSLSGTTLSAVRGGGTAANNAVAWELREYF